MSSTPRAISCVSSTKNSKLRGIASEAASTMANGMRRRIPRDARTLGIRRAAPCPTHRCTPAAKKTVSIRLPESDGSLHRAPRSQARGSVGRTDSWPESAVYSRGGRFCRQQRRVSMRSDGRQKRSGGTRRAPPRREGLRVGVIVLGGRCIGSISLGDPALGFDGEQCKLLQV